MFFNSYIFILLFLPLTLLGYFLCNHYKKYKLATAYLTVMSLWFYGYYSYLFLLTLLISIGINFGIGRVLYEKSHKDNLQKGLRVWEVMGILLNLGYLFVCKYYNFFIENMNQVFHSELQFLKIALPLGISFYTFQQIAYIVDSKRGETEKYSFMEYALFVSYFPQIVQGPIVLHSEFMPKLRDLNRRKVNYDNLLKGFYAFSLGFAKKLLIADNLAVVHEIGVSNLQEIGAFNAWIVMICYALQLYFDFSGYCDMAFGLGYMFNLEVPINFNSPYKARTIADFWDRWHMTLTKFFTKYIYFPLGGSRKGVARTYVNIMIVFLVSGLWHGAAWNYIVWGIMNGIAMIICRILKKPLSYIPSVLMILLTFVFNLFHWAMFSADSVANGFLLMKRGFIGGKQTINPQFYEAFNELMEMKLLTKLDVFSLQAKYPYLVFLIFIIALIFAVLFMRNTQQKVETYKPTLWKMSVSIILLTWCVISITGVTTFLYVNY